MQRDILFMYVYVYKKKIEMSQGGQTNGTKKMWKGQQRHTEALKHFTNPHLKPHHEIAVGKK